MAYSLAGRGRAERAALPAYFRSTRVVLRHLLKPVAALPRRGNGLPHEVEDTAREALETRQQPRAAGHRKYQRAIAEARQRSQQVADGTGKLPTLRPVLVSASTATRRPRSISCQRSAKAFRRA